MKKEKRKVRPIRIRLYKVHDMDLIWLYKTKYFNFRKALYIALKAYLKGQPVNFAYPKLDDLSNCNFKGNYKIVWNLDEENDADIINFLLNNTKDRCKNQLLKNIIRQSFVGLNVAGYSKVSSEDVIKINEYNANLTKSFPNLLEAPLTQMGEKATGKVQKHKNKEKASKKANTKAKENIQENIPLTSVSVDKPLNTTVKNNDITVKEVNEMPLNKTTIETSTPVQKVDTVESTKSVDTIQQQLSNLSKEDLLALLSEKLNTSDTNTEVKKEEKNSSSSENISSINNMDIQKENTLVDDDISLNDNDDIDDETADLMSMLNSLSAW